MKVKMKYKLDIEVNVETGKDAGETSIINLCLLKSDIISFISGKLTRYTTADEISDKLNSYGNPKLSISTGACKSEIILDL